MFLTFVSHLTKVWSVILTWIEALNKICQILFLVKDYFIQILDNEIRQDCVDWIPQFYSASVKHVKLQGQVLISNKLSRTDLT